MDAIKAILDTLSTSVPRLYACDNSLLEFVEFDAGRGGYAALRERAKRDPRFVFVPPNSFHVKTKFGCHSLKQTAGKLITEE